MLKFGEHLREHVLRSRRELGRSDRPIRSVVGAETWIVEDVHSRGEAGGHLIEADEPPERAGTDRAPAPMDYMMASLGFCQQVMVSQNAAVMGLRLESVRIEARGQFDRRGGRMEGIPNEGVTRARVVVDVRSPEPKEVVLELMEAVERECYVLNTYRRAMTIKQTVRLNGEVILTSEVGPR